MKLAKDESALLHVANNTKALAYVAVFSLSYVVFTAAALLDVPWFVNLFFAWLAGAAIGQLFIIGHDTAHGNFFRTKWLNRALGRWCMLPAWHNFLLWELHHNRIHHPYTNVIGKDHIWAPYSPEEYQKLPAYRRMLERVYRSPVGFPFYYLIEMWWKHFFLPISKHAAKNPRRYMPDVMLVAAWIVVQPLLVLWLGNQLSPERSALEHLLWGSVVPYLYWNAITGFVTFLNHNHPSVAWHKTKPNDDFHAWQAADTAHLSLPKPIEWMFLNIGQHIAHHLYPSIPLYNLDKAERIIQDRLGSKAISIGNGLKEFIGINRRCKLFDFEKNCWTDFAGKPTTALIQPIVTTAIPREQSAAVA
jgi:omega-6 fatty acid desaturase (delta-12 desaturase)